MSTPIDITYLGHLRCGVRAVPFAQTVLTDVPAGQGGLGENFSPTDLLAVALGTCVMTVVASVAQRHGIDMAGALARVEKELAPPPERRIGRIHMTIAMPAGLTLSPTDRGRLEKAVAACPVKQSLSPEIDVRVEIRYAEEPGMIDSHGRTIDYLRISVTDRCNLRCTYCMPPEGVPQLRHEDILSFEEIAEVARAAANMGVRKIRLTGGEPLVRRGVVELVGMLAAIEGLDDLSMTTNGLTLAEFAAPLAAAGLRRVNVSLDAVDPARYAAITRGGDVRRVFAGIEAARRAGLAPIRLNCVVQRDSSEPDARDVARFARDAGLESRFIQRMCLSGGTFDVVEGGSGGNCPRCNRLRLSSDGQVRPCLFSDLAFDVRKLGAAEALAQAVRHKPAAGSVCTTRPMHMIGG